MPSAMPKFDETSERTGDVSADREQRPIDAEMNAGRRESAIAELQTRMRRRFDLVSEGDVDGLEGA